MINFLARFYRTIFALIVGVILLFTLWWLAKKYFINNPSNDSSLWWVISFFVLCGLLVFFVIYIFRYHFYFRNDGYWKNAKEQGIYPESENRLVINNNDSLYKKLRLLCHDKYGVFF